MIAAGGGAAPALALGTAATLRALVVALDAVKGAMGLAPGHG